MENIDKIFYINIDRRTDRLSQFKKECDKMHFPNKKVQRFPAIALPGLLPALGCSMSHLQILKLAKEKKYQYIIIFEDDFEFLIDRKEFDRQLNEFFTRKLDFRVVMLAYNHKISDFKAVKIDDLLSKTTNVVTTSGFLVNMDYVDELIAAIETGCEMLLKTRDVSQYTIDVAWKKLQADKWYVFNRKFGKQRKSFSDINNREEDYDV